MTEAEDPKWLILWNVGILVGLIGLPALIGFFAGARIEAGSRMSLVPWRLLFVGLGVLVGGFAAWRTLMPRRATRRRE